jgi:hypothetical protein
MTNLVVEAKQLGIALPMSKSLRVYPCRFQVAANDFPTSRAASMNLCEAGPSVRFFSVTIPFGRPATESSTGKILISARRLKNFITEAVGVRLLDRDRHGIEPTPYGRALLDCGVAVFDDLRRSSGWRDGWQTSVAVYGLLVVLTGFVLLLLLQMLDIGARADDVPPSSRPSNQGARDLAEGWGLKDAKGYSILSGIHIIDSAGRTACLTLLPFLLLQKGAASASVGLALALVFAGGVA